MFPNGRWNGEPCDVTCEMYVLSEGEINYSVWPLTCQKYAPNDALYIGRLHVTQYTVIQCITASGKYIKNSFNTFKNTLTRQA